MALEAPLVPMDHPSDECLQPPVLLSPQNEVSRWAFPPHGPDIL